MFYLRSVFRPEDKLGKSHNLLWINAFKAQGVDFEYLTVYGAYLSLLGIIARIPNRPHVRLKRSGAWWYEANSNQMLALRCAKYNGTLAQVFVRYQQQLRKTSE